MRVNWQANNFTPRAPNFLPDVKATQFTLSLLKYLAPSESSSWLFAFGFAFVYDYNFFWLIFICFVCFLFLFSSFILFYCCCF